MKSKSNPFVAGQRGLPGLWGPRIAQAPTTYARAIAAAREFYSPKSPALAVREDEGERRLPRCGGAA